MPVNKFRVTLTSFLAYFVMSAVISPLGIVTGPVARHYDLSITVATAGFSYLTAGILVGTLVSFVIFDLVRIKNIILCFSGLNCLSLASIYIVDLYLFFPLWLFLAGLSCGVNLTAGIIVITNTYTAGLRASMMLLTDSFYSMAGVISTFLAGIFILNQLHWSSAYLLAFTVSLLIIFVAWFSSFPTVSKRESTPVDRGASNYWPVEIYLIGASILIYLAGFVTIYTWIPNYTQEQFNLNPDTAGKLISRLFLGMFIGQLIMFFLVLKFSPTRVIFISGLLSTLLTVTLWSVDSVSHLIISVFILGLVTGGMLKLIIAFGTMLVAAPSPKMISYLIFNSALGTAIAPAASALIVERYEMVTALQFTSLCYCMMFALLVFSYISQRRKTRLISQA